VIQISKEKINPAVAKDFFKNNIKRDLIQILSNEAEAINYLIENFPTSAQLLVETILQTKGRVVFCGMGKSGFVARKLVATFSSLGIVSLFLHPAEALHGDLGMVGSEDLFIAISKSGTGIELEQIIPLLRSQGNKTVLICCANGILSKQVDLTVALPFKKEACDLNLAPTSSSTLCMAFGDALAVVVSKLKGFGKNDFAKFHPAGALGKRLLLKVSCVMHKEDELPFINFDTKFEDLLLTITSKKLGVGIVVDEDKKLLGVVTDGDLRRVCEHGPQIFNKKASEIMTPKPKTITEDILAYDALKIMEEFNITSLVVTQRVVTQRVVTQLVVMQQDDGKVVGLVHIHDLLKSGLSLD